MDLECVICCGLLTEVTEDEDVQWKGRPPRYHRHGASFAGPSSGAVAPASPELCVPPCGHMFHKKCLVNWIRSGYNQSCPTCRKVLIERRLVTVFLPIVSPEQKKCEECEATKETCAKLTAEKEELKKLYDEKVERVKDLEEKNERLYQLYMEKLGICWKLSEKERIVDQLIGEKEHLKRLYEKEKERRGKGEENGGKPSVEGNDSRGGDLLLMEKRRGRIIAWKLLEEERKVEELTTEKEKFKKLLEEEVERRKGVEMEAKKNEEVLSEGYAKRLHQLIKENSEFEWRLLEERRKGEKVTTEKKELEELLEEEVERRKGVEVEAKKIEEVLSEGYVKRHQLIKENAEIKGKLLEKRRRVVKLEQQAVEVKRRELAVNRRRDGLQLDIDVQLKFLQERAKVEEVQGTLNELQECHRLLIGDIEEMTKKYEAEQEKANILEGRVASIEAQRDQQHQQKLISMPKVDSTDSNAGPSSSMLNYVDWGLKYVLME